LGQAAGGRFDLNNVKHIDRQVAHYRHDQAELKHRQNRHRHKFPLR